MTFYILLLLLLSYNFMYSCITLKTIPEPRLGLAWGQLHVGVFRTILATTDCRLIEGCSNNRSVLAISLLGTAQHSSLARADDDVGYTYFRTQLLCSCEVTCLESCHVMILSLHDIVLS